jgi:hypothetical protein
MRYTAGRIDPAREGRRIRSVMCGHHRHHRHAHHHTTARRPEERTSTIPDDDVRASDAEREEVVSALRTHAGDGRLSVDELSDRIDRAHAVRTRRELNALLSDLPRQPRPRRDERAEFGEHLRSYLSVMALLVVIWALTGMGYFWPIWPAVGWGFFVLTHASAARRPRRARAT